MNKFLLVRVAIVLSAGLLKGAAVAADESQIFDSGDRKNELIELYTSEGCSSCPPADRWLSSLKAEPSLWRDIIPVAFHVDYWDRLGWKDRFASRAHSQRQRSYARAYREPTVYTPGVRLNGAEWRAWRRSNVTGRQSAEQSVGALRLTVDKSRAYSASFRPTDSGSKTGYRLNLALLGMDLSSNIERGENRGKNLQHDFVVLANETVTDPLVKHVASGRKEFQWTGSLPASKLTAPSYAVAAWITHVTPEGDNLTTYLDPIQATGGYLKD